MPTGKPESSPEERFLRKCVPTPCVVPDMSDCWIWTGATSGHPYAQLTRQTYGTSMAHQWACHHWNKSPLPVEPGMCVKHRCDTRLCVNPEHLSYGTLQENIQEMVERNPKAMGRIAPTEEELQMLKTMIAEGIPRREMSRRINHSRYWIDRVKRDYNIS